MSRNHKTEEHKMLMLYRGFVREEGSCSFCRERKESGHVYVLTARTLGGATQMRFCRIHLQRFIEEANWVITI